MAKILFVSPEALSEEYGNFLSNLAKKYKVTHVEHGIDMMSELRKEQMEIGILDEPDAPEYDLVICDAGLFFSQLPPKERAEYFTKEILPYLKGIELPVILLAEKDMSHYIREAVTRSGITQFDKPFDVDKVLEAVDSLNI